MSVILGLPADVRLSRCPLVVDLDEDCGGGAQKERGVWEDLGDSGPPLQLLLDRPAHRD